MMDSRDIVFNKLAKYIDGRKHAWIGSKPLIDAEPMLLNIATNFRAAKQHNQIYDTVWLIEGNIFDVYAKSWLLLMDETVRLIKSEGFIIVRTKDTIDGTLFALKSHLFRNLNIDVELTEQIKTAESSVSIFKIKRKNISHYHDVNWSIGILTNGKKNENVINLVNKINRVCHQKKAGSVEIIIAGPRIESLLCNENIHYICDDQLDELPRISEKKNKIVTVAKHSNVAIFHDRYQIDDNFFDGFDIFGYDFDFVTVRQLYPSGAEFPAYLMFPENEKRWQTPVRIDNYDQLQPSSFLNGGLLIVKKHVAQRVNFNPLLLHNEAEDVEISMQLLSNGVVPRMNAFSLAYTIGIDESYTSTFVTHQPRKKSIRRLMLKLWCLCPQQFRSIIKSSRIYEKAKNFYNN